MANVIEVVLKAVDQATGVIRGVADNTSSAGSRMRNTFTELNSAMQIAGQVWGAVQRVAEQTVGAVVEYNKSILDLAQSLGITTEEASRLVQVSDDFGISQGELESALKMMTKNGLQPTIDNLAILSDEFNGIEDPVARAQKMSELLGRNWSTLTPLLKTGGQEIRNMAANVSASLIVTDDSIAATERWRLQVDDLNDSMTGLKMTIGSQIIPVLSNAAMALDLIFNSTGRLISAFDSHNAEVVRTGVTYEAYIAEMQRAAEAMGWSINQSGFLVDGLGKVRSSTFVLTETQYANTQIQISMAAGYAAMKANIEGTDTATRNLSVTTASASDLMKTYNTQLLYTIASQGLTAEGAIALADSMGLIDDTTKLAYEAAAEYKAQLDAGKITQDEYNERIRIMDGLLKGLNGKKYKTSFELDLEVDAEMYEWEEFLKNQAHPKKTREQEAAGGTWTIPPGAGFESFYLGAGHWASPGETVTVTPAGGQPSGTSKSVVINVSVGNGMDFEELMFNLQYYMARML